MRSLLVLGMGLYGVSFFLPAVRDEGRSVPGYLCAYVSLVVPWTKGDWARQPGTEACLLLAGWVNLVFLAGLFLRWKYAVPDVIWMAVGLVSFCWVYFWLSKTIPMVGHVVWVLGIVCTALAIGSANLPQSQEYPMGHDATKRSTTNP